MFETTIKRLIALFIQLTAILRGFIFKNYDLPA